MTPKEKAIELCVKFFKPSVFEYEEKQYLVDEENAKQSALICVDEILENNYGAKFQMIFWKEVKQEINKL
jgi:hypothetical protein